LTEVTEAEALVLARMPRFAAEKAPLGECVGAVLREDVVAERDQPPFDRVTMDGIAIAYRDWAGGTRRFEVVGTQGAGAPPLRLAESGQCAEVMTGAMLPWGSDTVIPVERLTAAGSARIVAADLQVDEQQFVHRRGSDRAAGRLLLSSGTRVGPAEMAVLASAGYAQVAVSKRPRVAVISTGDELVGVADEAKPYQIRSSNDRAIEAALVRRQLALVSRARLNDDPQTLLEAVQRLHAQHDVLILSGGVSMGQYDFVPEVLERLGVEMIFHRIEQRPGRPMWFGISDEGKPIFALPGNPVSTLVCLARYVEPALRHAMGIEHRREAWVKLGATVELSANLTYFMPVVLNWTQQAVAVAQPRATNTSGDFVSLVGTDGFVELPRGESSYREGRVVRLFRW
jgi:molybdopterin molybdotransferase